MYSAFPFLSLPMHLLMDTIPSSFPLRKNVKAREKKGSNSETERKNGRVYCSRRVFWWRSRRSALSTKRGGCATKTGPRAAGVSQLELPPPRVGVQTLQDRRKFHRLARSWMGTNQKVRWKAQLEHQVRGSNRVRREAATWPTWCTCAPGSAARCGGGMCQGTPASLHLQPHKTPRFLLGLDLGSRDPRCKPVQLLLCCIMQTCAVWDLSKSCSHSHPLGPCREFGSVSLKCFTRGFYSG